jgi:DNA-binding FadR family transcriptional regulator
MEQRRKTASRMARRPPGSRIHAELAAGIGELILNGTYPPGSLLPNEAEWGRRFRASRTAVREAIRTLNGKGLLVSRPKIGSRVEPRERWNLLDRDVMAWHRAAMDERSFLLALQEVRRILEPGVAVLAAGRRSGEQLAALEAALEAMRAASDPQGHGGGGRQLPPPPAGGGQQRAAGPLRHHHRAGARQHVRLHDQAHRKT